MFQGTRHLPKELFSFLDHTDLMTISRINQQFAQESHDERRARCMKRALLYFHISSKINDQ
jgi:hypothetical protein